ncbi:echinoderm microtubule-associated protein-like 2 isoform X4 [Mytilus galloprovincialis]|uniref:echinoderm microtubule-associated protein-like 2 isoform X4 n=1 Tax=Mytilus galloprovincialis TaxID=29158 RepID=UPI003F7CC6EC
MYLAVEHQIDDVFHTASALKVKMDESTDFSSSIANGVDGLLRQDQVEVCERVTYLEKKVRVQEDEIVCLKSAVADILRRLNQVEAEKAQNSILPTKPVFKSSTPHKTTPRTPRRTPLDNVYVTPPTRHSTPPSSAKSRTPIKKWGSMTNSTELNGSHNVSSKDPQWNSEEGNLRIYLRGRPVSLYAPSDLSDYSVDKEVTTPDQKLQLEYVFGYRGRDCRSNLYYLNGEVIYFCAGVVVLHNPEEQTQRHYLGHTDDVKCLAIHPDKVRVATGQVAGHDRKDSKKKKEESDKKPHVRIWHSTSLNTLHVIGIGDFDRSVCCLSFSKQDGGAKLCVVDESNEHEVFVYDVEKGRKLANTKGSQDPILAVEFHPSEPNSIIDVGKGHIQFWTLESGKLTKKSGVFDKVDKPKYMLCIAFAENGDVITGDSNGSIIVWPKGSTKAGQAITGAHEGGIFSICVDPEDGTILTGGGKDRKIVQWDSSYQRTGLTKEIGEEYGGVRMISKGQGGPTLIGTTKNAILCGSLDLELQPLVQGHIDELWGLACHPSQQQFLTAGSDKMIHMWDSTAKTAVWSLELPDPGHSCCFSPDGSAVVVGMETGRWVAIDTSTHNIVDEHTDGNEQIECCLFSPDGSHLALGSRDNYIYVYDVQEGGQKYNRIGRCHGHSSFITHIDWSADGKYICSNSGDYEVLFWNVPSCEQETSSSSLRDVEWASQNCTLSFATAGIWPRGADGTDINNCAKAHKKPLLVSADDFGKVNLFKYPCSQPKTKCQSFKAHSSHVTNVAFLFDDSRVLSTGGNDMSVMQWQIVAADND